MNIWNEDDLFTTKVEMDSDFTTFICNLCGYLFRVQTHTISYSKREDNPRVIESNTKLQHLKLFHGDEIGRIVTKTLGVP